MSTKQPRISTTGVGILALCAALVLAACGGDPKVRSAERFARGEQYFADGKLDEAIIELRGAIQLDPMAGRARYRLAEAYARKNDPQSAFGEFVRAADLLPDDVAVQQSAGDVLLLARRYDEARARAERVVALDPKGTAGLVLLGNAQSGLGNLDGAVATLEKAIALAPGRGVFHSMLGAVHTKRGDDVAAAAAYARAVEVEPGSVEAQVALGLYRVSQGDVAAAEGPLLEARRLAPEDRGMLRALVSLYAGSGRLPQAEPYLTQLADGGDRDAAFSLVDVLLSTGRRNDADSRLARLAAQKETTVQATLRRAALQHGDGRREEAYAAVAGLLKGKPSLAAALALRGRFELQDGEASKAEASLRAAVAADPRDGAAAFWLGQALLRQRQFDEAERAFEGALRLSPSSGSVHVELSRLMLRRGRAADAVTYARDAVRLAPRDGAGRAALVRALAAAGDLGGATRALAAVSAGRERDPQLRMLEGELRLARKDPAGAARAFSEALEASPALYEALDGLVASRLATGDAEGARRDVAAALARTSEDAGALVAAGRGYLQARDFAQAVSVLQRALALAPDRIEAYALLATSYVLQDRLDDAVREYERLAARQPKAAAPRIVLGMLHQTASRRAQARQSYLAALEADPRAAVASNNLAWMDYEDGTNLDVALQRAQAAKAQLPDSPEVNDTLGAIYLKKGLASSAVDALKAAVAAAPQEAAYQVRLGQAYAVAGEPALARRALEAALRLQPGGEVADDARRALATLR